MCTAAAGREHICNRSEALGEFLPRRLPPRTPTCRVGSLETMSCLPLFFLPTSPELLTSHRQAGSWGKGGETASVGPGRRQVSGLNVLSHGFHHTSTADICCRRLRIINSSLGLLVRALNATKGFKYLLFPTAWVSCSQTKKGDFLSSRKPEISSCPPVFQYLGLDVLVGAANECKTKEMC